MQFEDLDLGPLLGSGAELRGIWKVAVLKAGRNQRPAATGWRQELKCSGGTIAGYGKSSCQGALKALGLRSGGYARWRSFAPVPAIDRL